MLAVTAKKGPPTAIIPFIKNPKISHTYASIAGNAARGEYIKEYDTKFSPIEKKYFLDPHFKIITDLGFVYENNKQIELYIVGCFTSKKGPNRYGFPISKEKNLMGQRNKQQFCTFFHEKIRLKVPFEYKADSIPYFWGNDDKPSKKLETHRFFKKFQEDVKQDHAKRGIKSSIAKTKEEQEHTGLRKVMASQNFIENEQKYNENNEKNDPTAKFPLYDDASNEQ